MFNCLVAVLLFNKCQRPSLQISTSECWIKLAFSSTIISALTIFWFNSILMLAGPPRPSTQLQHAVEISMTYVGFLSEYDYTSTGTVYHGTNYLLRVTTKYTRVFVYYCCIDRKTLIQKWFPIYTRLFSHSCVLVVYREEIRIQLILYH